MGEDGAWEVEFYLKGVATMTVASFGILGNLISIRVASVGNLGWNPTFTRLLIWLALLDSLFLVFVILLFGLPTVSTEFSNKILPVLFPSLLPVTSIMLTASVYTVVCLSIERLLHLRRPQWSNKGALMGYILPVLAFSTFYNFPKFFEFTTIYPQNGPAYPEATEFRRNTDYSLYVLTINCVVMGLLPFSLLIGMNLSIARYFNHNSAGTDMRESSMKGLLLAIVVVQLFCHAPRTGLNIYEMVMAFKGSPISLDEPWLIDLSHLLLVISASCNVFIYAIQDARFRNLLLSHIKEALGLYHRRRKTESRQLPAEPLLAASS